MRPWSFIMKELAQHFLRIMAVVTLLLHYNKQHIRFDLDIPLIPVSVGVSLDFKDSIASLLPSMVVIATRTLRSYLNYHLSAFA